jgi:galactoside 2-L-fucosyltransferase 1/2
MIIIMMMMNSSYTTTCVAALLLLLKSIQATAAASWLLLLRKTKNKFIASLLLLCIIISIITVIFIIIHMLLMVAWVNNNNNTGHFSVNSGQSSSDNKWVGFVTRHQFGNQLWELASTHGIAKSRQSGWCMIDDSGAFGSKYAAYLQWTTPPPEKCPGWIWITNHFWYTSLFTPIGDDGKYATYSERFVNSNSQRIRVDSCLQSFKYFDKLHPVPFRLRATHIAQEWVKTRKINTAIHVRRGDKVNDNANVVPPLLYFTLAIRTLNQLFPVRNNESRGFVVVTDDVTWVGQSELFANMSILSSVNLGFDMAVISACQHKILSIGTFGWWGAFLGDNNNNNNNHTSAVIYPNLQMEGSAKDGFNNEDYFPSHWTGIDYY